MASRRDFPVFVDGEAQVIACPDCKGTGWYTGFNEHRPCPTCRGGS